MTPAPAAPATPAIQYGGGYFTADMLQVAVTSTEERPVALLATTDGSEPTYEDVVNATLQLTETTNVKARAILMTEEGDPYQTPEGEYIYSEVVEAQFTKVSVPAAPVFTPAAGEYIDKVEVSIACATENVLIKYEIGATPATGKSPTYLAPFELTTTTVVSAMAFLVDGENKPIETVDGMTVESEVVFAEYIIKPVAPEYEKPEAPTFTPEAGEYTSEVNVTLSCVTENVIILYNLVGLNPDFTSPRFEEEPITITEIKKLIKAHSKRAPSFLYTQ